MIARILALLLLMAPASAMAEDSAADARRYSDCMLIVRQKPQTAYDEASGWRADGGGVPAMHCQALALIELGQPARAAGILDAAREAMAKQEGDRALPLAAMLAAQAGNAWMLANDPARARERMSRALDIYDAQSPYRIEALIDRARASAALGLWDETVTDLGAALTLDGERTDALLFRATALRLKGDLTGAEADILAAGKLAPKDPDILFERGAIRAAQGRIDEARADWRATAKSAGTSAAQRATEALGKLDKK